jgi:hypothetical protein
MVPMYVYVKRRVKIAVLSARAAEPDPVAEPVKPL